MFFQSVVRQPFLCQYISFILFLFLNFLDLFGLIIIVEMCHPLMIS